MNPRRARSLPGGEAGFTMVEVLVAILILATGAIAILGVFDTSTRNTFRAEQAQVAINRAQRELEQIRQLPYDDVGLTVTPGHVGDPKDPRYRVSGNNFALGWDGTTASNYADMVVNGVGNVTSGTIAPGPTSFASGDVSGKVYRFVVWQNDPNCGTCAGSHDYKRVVVVVKLDTVAVSYARSYTEVQSNFSDPDATYVSDTPPGSGGAILTAQQFFLADTTCNHSTPDDPSTLSDHPQHQTTGACDEPNPSKPDGLYPDAPGDIDPDDPDNPPFHDFATDVEPALNPDQDKGLQLLRQDVNGCTYNPGSPQYKIHRWVSQPMTQDFVMSGQATLKLYTRTINDVNAQGTVCMFLFVRKETASECSPASPPCDQLLIDLNNPPNAFFVWSQNQWPRNSWQLGKPPPVMNFSNKTVLQGQRLGLEIAVRRNGTSGDVLEFYYDHPDLNSRLEVKTTTPLP